MAAAGPAAYTYIRWADYAGDILLETTCFPTAGKLRRFIRLLILLAGTGSTACSKVSDTSVREHLQIAEDLRLDANTEDFSAIRRFYVGPLGQIVIPLLQDMELRVYDSSGVSIGRVGRRGSGPGEFQHIAPVGWLGKDTLVVWDTRLRRLTYFGPRLEIVRTRTLSAPLAPTALKPQNGDSTYILFDPYVVHSDESVLGTALLRTGPPGRARGTMTRVILTLRDSAGARVIATPPQYEDERWAVTINGLTNPVPFALQPQLAVSPDGQRFGFILADQTSEEGGTYTLALFGLNGDTIVRRSFPFVGVAIPQSAIDSAIGALGSGIRQSGEVGSDLAARFEAMVRSRAPAVYAPTERLTLGLDGTTWIELRPVSQGRPVIALDSQGNELGTITLPVNARIQQASSTHIWVAERDEFDLVSVVRYRVSGVKSSKENDRPN